MMINTLSIQPLIGDESNVNYMTGHLDTKHGWYKVSISYHEDVVMVTADDMYKKNVTYVKSFDTLGEAMTALLTMKFNDERFLKID